MTNTPYLDGEKLSTRTFFQKDLLPSIVELLANYGHKLNINTILLWAWCTDKSGGYALIIKIEEDLII